MNTFLYQPPAEYWNRHIFDEAFMRTAQKLPIALM